MSAFIPTLQVCRFFGANGHAVFSVRMLAFRFSFSASLISFEFLLFGLQAFKFWIPNLVGDHNIMRNIECLSVEILFEVDSIYKQFPTGLEQLSPSCKAFKSSIE